MQAPQDSPPPTTLSVTPNDVGLRLDAYLARCAAAPACAAALKGLSRARLQHLIAAGAITLRPAHTKRAVAPEFSGTQPSHRLRLGEAIALAIPELTDVALTPHPMPLTILYEDAHLIALDKPAGLVVHPGAGTVRPTLVHGLLAHCTDLSGIGGERRPGIVHRLDKDTSGVLLVAKHDRAHTALARMFAARQVHKVYRAVVWGVPRAPRALWRTPFARHPTQRQRFTSRPELTARGGARPREAITEYEVIAAAHGMACILVTLHTGRTHQIRVHCADHGHPIVGDALYGPTSRRRQGQPTSAVPTLPQHALHAWRLDCAHPCSGAPLRLEAPMPAALQVLWRDVCGP